MWFRSIQMNSIHGNRYSSDAYIFTTLASGSSFTLPSVCDSTSVVGSSLALWHCRMPSYCLGKRIFALKHTHTHSRKNKYKRHCGESIISLPSKLYCPCHLFLAASTHPKKRILFLRF